MAWILGIKGAGGWHNSGVCLLDSESGAILFSAEEERYNNVVHSSQYPIGAQFDALAMAGISCTDIDCVAYPVSTRAMLETHIIGFVLPLAESDNRYLPNLRAEIETFAKLHRVEQLLGRVFPHARVLMLDHHLCHAASAYYCSPFDEAAVLTIDGMGEHTTTAFYKAEGNAIRALGGVEFPHSLGLVYTLMCIYLGLSGMNPEGKLMGLAPYGEPRFLDIFRDLIVTTETGYQLGTGKFALGGLGQWPILLPGEFLRGLGLPRDERKELTQCDMDIAASLQARLEEVCLHLVRELHRVTGSKNLCLAGGVALNSVMNKRVLDETPFKNVFIQPAANDGGTPLGAALLVKHAALGKSRERTRWTTPYLGAEWSCDEVKALLKARGIAYDRPQDPGDLTERVAREIAGGKIVGWFQGRAELGPRALGNRSILCDPRPAEMKDRLNERVKHREWYRPYAPAVLAERATEYFDLGCESPYMLLVAEVRPEKREEIAAVTHVDGTARVQTVSREQNPRFYDLIRYFGELTGTPVLLNTSFNVRGETIVNSPEDALDCFLFTDLDVLVVEDFLVLKQDNLSRRLNLSLDEYLQRRCQRYSERHEASLPWLTAQIEG